MVRNFWNLSIRATIVGLEDGVGPNPNESKGGTIVVVLDCGGL